MKKTAVRDGKGSYSEPRVAAGADMRERVNKQGLRDLNPVGHNGHNSRACRHCFAGPCLVIGTRWAVDPHCLDSYEKPIYGKKCLWCAVIQEQP